SRGCMEDPKAQYGADSQEMQAPVQKEQVSGNLNFQVDGKTIEQRPLVGLQEIPEGNFFGKIIDYIKLMFHHWFG
ncbi:serine-type D-Ala-D-Ala carboxypeptidase, partial [Escherichia coli]|nr:serine-type D-Ala-D-Ala carboxypeptidase [Escherichia coli]